MINLLPDEKKKAIQYARRNARLRKWSTVLICVCALLILVTASGILVLKKSTDSFNARTHEGQKSLEQQNQEQVKKQVETISGSLKLVVQVLSKQVLFSSLIKQIGSVMPSGSVLTNLSINKLEGGIDLQAAATDYQTASQVQVNLSDPSSKIFEKADLLNIQCKSPTDAAPDPFTATYPCTVQVRALFKKDNPFLFINKDGN